MNRTRKVIKKGLLLGAALSTAVNITPNISAKAANNNTKKVTTKTTTKVTTKETAKTKKVKVKLNKTKATITAGKTTTLKLNGYKKKIKWSTSNKKVATVNSKGKVTGKKAGTVTITATAGKKKYTCKITVKKAQTKKQTSQKEQTQQTPAASQGDTTSQQPAAKDPLEGITAQGLLKKQLDIDQIVSTYKNIYATHVTTAPHKAEFSWFNYKKDGKLMLDGIYKTTDAQGNMKVQCLINAIDKTGYYVSNGLCFVEFVMGKDPIASFQFFTPEEIEGIKVKSLKAENGKFLLETEQKDSLYTVITDYVFDEKTQLVESAVCKRYDENEKLTNTEEYQWQYGVEKEADTSAYDRCVTNQGKQAMDVTVVFHYGTNEEETRQYKLAKDCYLFADEVDLSVEYGLYKEPDRVEEVTGLSEIEGDSVTLYAMEKPKETPASDFEVLPVEGKEDEVAICSYKGDDTNVVIPETIDGKKVTGIELLSFNEDKHMKTISIPATVTSLSSFAFWSCPELQKIIVDWDNENYKSQDGILYNKNGDTLIYCPSNKQGKLTIPEGVTKIQEWALVGCEDIDSLILPESLKTIGEFAMDGCGIKSIRIPKNVDNIEGIPFREVYQLETIEVDEDNETYASKDGFLYTKDMKKLLRCPEATKETTVHIPADMDIQDMAFIACDNIENIEVEAGNKTHASEDGILYDAAMEKLITCPKGKKKATLHEGTKVIGENAFFYCDKLTDIVIPEGVTTLEDLAFNGCESLESITIPASVTEIGNRVLRECNKLKTIRGMAGSKAEEYAKEQGIAFEKIEEPVTYSDLSYGTDKNQNMDLILPAKDKANGGVILMIHGGAWVEGDKRNGYTDELMEKYKDSGYTVATMNYRFTDKDTTIDEMLDDVELALNFIKKKASENGIDTQKAMLVGWSSGGHMAELYGYTRAKHADIEVACVTAYSGIADISNQGLYIDNPLDDILGRKMTEVGSYLCGHTFDADTISQAEADLKKASPITYASTAVPTIICHSAVDTYVDYETAVNLKKALDAGKVENCFIDFPKSGHDLLLDPDSLTQSYEKLEEYAKKYLK